MPPSPFRRNRVPGFGWHRTGRAVDLVVALGIIGALALGAAVLQYRAGIHGEATGQAEAIDGDSLRLSGRELRLKGLDAPEFRQSCEDPTGRPVACGRGARRALAAILARGAIACRWSEIDRYERPLVRCLQGESDIGAELVRSGQAIAFGDYAAEEAQAKAARRGLWAMRFQRPAEWRREHQR